MHLSASIKQEGHETDLITTEEDYESKIREFQPDMIAYSIMTGDQEFYNDLNKELKQKFQFFSIVGGPHATFFPDDLEKLSFDSFIIGEAESSIQKFLNNPKETSIPNFHFKTPEGIIKNPVCNLVEDLDKIPFPDRDIVFKYPKIRDGPIKHFIASRGCPYNCSYCFNESYSKIYQGKGKRVRFRSVDNLLHEVKQVIKSSPTRFVYFQDDTFILYPDWIKEFAEKYPKITNLSFHCHIRANLVTEDIVKDLKKAGCYSVHIASEAGNEQVRSQILNRNMTDQQIINAVQLLKKYNIKVMLQNILGLPFTTLKNDLETLELNIKCKPDYSWVSIFQPYPKTALGIKSQESGIYQGDFSDLGSNFFDTSPLNIENKNEISNLQKLFAIAVKYPEIYHSGILQSLIELPYEHTKEKFTKLYREFRKKGDKILYGFDL